MNFVNNLDPELLNYGFIHIRWYGLMFLIGIMLNLLVVRWAFKREKYHMEDMESCALYLFVGLILGARLGHILFYEFNYYWAHPLDVFKIWNGGLASHGAAIGVFVAYSIWVLVHKVKFSKYVDLFVMAFPLTAMFVRIGNFFNSEIVGIKTTSNFGVIFQRLGEDFPRYPAQLFEAVLSYVIFVFFFFTYKYFWEKTPKLFYVFSYMGLYFTGRFFIEFVKDLHGPLPTDFPLSMGQVLSIIPILIAVGYFLYVAFSSYKKHRPQHK